MVYITISDFHETHLTVDIFTPKNSEQSVNEYCLKKEKYCRKLEQERSLGYNLAKYVS